MEGNRCAAYREMRDREGHRGRWNRSSVTYVAGGLAFRGPPQAPDVLLIQESKPSCMGKWYLPMGRVEAGEELWEGAAREVKEESGLDVQVNRLLVAAVGKSTWHRFIFACTVIGGTLKQTGDEESMCADWWPVKTVLEQRIPMRGEKEIFRSLHVGWEHYRKTGSPHNLNWTSVGSLCVKEPSPSLVYRLILTRSGEKDALVGGDGSVPSVAVPLSVYKPRYYVVQRLRSLLGESAEVRVCPPVVLSLRAHLGPDSRHSGLALTLLFRIRDPPPTNDGLEPLKAPPPPYQWRSLSEDIAQQLATFRQAAAPYFIK